ncbi:inositol monophosphatase family protein [Auraticoccus cholistanensis]|uniref:inositol monophosphatase family protein n=1 Tax=Auraticoccus cholistanensis TaxID=2656650 RepID=UPI0012E73EA8
MDPAELSAVAVAAARAGAAVAMDWRRRAGSLQVRHKAGPSDLVSQADTDTEETIRSVILGRRPHDGILGEEGGSVAGTGEVTWVVDPVDGTTNYVYGRPDWAVSVAAVRADDQALLAGAVAEPAVGRLSWAHLGGGAWADGERLHVPDRTDLAHTLVEVNWGRGRQKDDAAQMVAALLPRVRDVRRGGSAAAALAQLATGRADAVWTPGLSPWDCAAGALLVHEAGGTVGDLDGPCPGRFPASGDVLAAPPALWGPLRELLLPVYTARRAEATGSRPPA